MKAHKIIRAKLIRENKIADKRLKFAEKVGSFVIIYLTIASIGIVGLAIYVVL